MGPQLNFSTGQFNSVEGRGNSSCFQALFFALGFRSHRVYTFLAPNSAFDSRLVGKSIGPIVFCLRISLLSADYGDVILKVVVKRGLVSVPRNNKI